MASHRFVAQFLAGCDATASAALYSYTLYRAEHLDWAIPVYSCWSAATIYSRYITFSPRLIKLFESTPSSQTYGIHFYTGMIASLMKAIASAYALFELGDLVNPIFGIILAAILAGGGFFALFSFLGDQPKAISEQNNRHISRTFYGQTLTTYLSFCDAFLSATLYCHALNNHWQQHQTTQNIAIWCLLAAMGTSVIYSRFIQFYPKIVERFGQSDNAQSRLCQAFCDHPQTTIPGALGALMKTAASGVSLFKLSYPVDEKLSTALMCLFLPGAFVALFSLLGEDKKSIAITDNCQHEEGYSPLQGQP